MVLSAISEEMCCDTEDEGYLSDESTSSDIPLSIWAGEEYEGRRYHALHAGRYPFPDDEAEYERLGIMHLVWKSVLEGSDTLALINASEPLTVLDVGTGPGEWAVDFARHHPHAIVTGIDLSPPRRLWAPRNLRFEISDFDELWPSTKYDFIHGRLLAGSIRDAPTFMRRCSDSLNSGGTVELQDVLPFRCDDGSLAGTSLEEYGIAMQIAARRRGLDLEIALQYEAAMRAAELENVHFEIRKLPLNAGLENPAFHQSGGLLVESILVGLSGMSLKLLKQDLNMQEEEYQMLLFNVRQDVRNRRIHAYLPIVIVYGRKPRTSQF
ncbi:hypothetical protein LTR64_008750 [Lithohypha guttulata]|uniref:uncharacterized protein n=1 Tax=Lithohypha guttulata TaxID=1690604 RepID=UPI00315CA91F